jgi:hypothetical protein
VDAFWWPAPLAHRGRKMLDSAVSLGLVDSPRCSLGPHPPPPGETEQAREYEQAGVRLGDHRPNTSQGRSCSRVDRTRPTRYQRAGGAPSIGVGLYPKRLPTWEQ